MVSGGIAGDGLSDGRVDPCRAYSLGLEDNSILYVQCGCWMHGGFLY